MLTTIRISADVGNNARNAAINQAKAQGYRMVNVINTQQVGPREYDVTMLVSK